MFDNEDIKKSCDVILNSGCLTDEEASYLQKCKDGIDPNKFLIENKDNPILVSIFSKLSKIEKFINEKEY